MSDFQNKIFVTECNEKLNKQLLLVLFDLGYDWFGATHGGQSPHALVLLDSYCIVIDSDGDITCMEEEDYERFLEEAKTDDTFAEFEIVTVPQCILDKY